MKRESTPGILTIPLSDVADLISKPQRPFPKYTTQILNLANQTAQGTRPKVVGQMSELVQRCPTKTFDGWVKWYESGHRTAIHDATERIWAQVQRYRDAAGVIDRPMVERWVRDLVLTKTFVGLRAQDVILELLSERFKLSPIRRASPSEESRGIDGFVGGHAVSVKPVTYKAQVLPETISVPIVYYEKTDKGLVIDATALLTSIG